MLPRKVVGLGCLNWDRDEAIAWLKAVCEVGFDFRVMTKLLNP